MNYLIFKKIALCVGVIVTLNCLGGHCCAEDDHKPAASISFNRDIRPILSDKCFQCHGPDEESREADLRFDIKESALQVINPGDLEDSELIQRILADDPDIQMPPDDAKKSLSQSEIELLKKWITQGADWSEFWAYVPPQKTPVPALESDLELTNWIDKLVVSRLQANGLTLSPPADKTTRLRRVYFDLIGLPPTPQQVDDFLADPAPDAFEKVVDKLLASEHFGERMAIYWLDLVRYADTVGYHGDQDHNISPYRDWVINAFNSNMPFDQFTREQLAGDLLEGSTESQKIATGYNRLLQTTHEGGLQPKEYSAIYAADRVRNVSLVWMGATVGCAQCHDHKYDPYTARDFYSLAAFFADIDDEQHFKSGTNALPTKRPPEILILSDEDRKELERVKKRVNETAGQISQQKKQIEQLSKDEAQDNELNELNELKKELVDLETKLKQLQSSRQKIESRGTWTMVTAVLPQPRTTRLLPRGNWLDESGPIVFPAIPQFLGGLDTGSTPANRLDLANWLTDGSLPSGQLTARVFANRFWYLYTGVGISRSLDDFGGQGEPPAFPELLDNLAIDFVENDWNIKHLVRQIVTSQTYQQSSIETAEIRKQDPYNQLFSHQSRYRLPAELIRDNALAISGLLNIDEVGGKSIKPYQPAGYYQHLNFPPRKYSPDTDERQWRRGVYMHWQRQFLHPSLKAFDAPSREECTAQRPKSNTPSAALALLNDPIFVEAARKFAERIVTESPDDNFETQLITAFKIAVSRNPQTEEIQILKRLFEDSRQEFAQDQATASGLLAVGQASTNEQLDQTQLAAWTTVARAILNMNETITRN